MNLLSCFQSKHHQEKQKNHQLYKKNKEKLQTSESKHVLPFSKFEGKKKGKQFIRKQSTDKSKC